MSARTPSFTTEPPGFDRSELGREVVWDHDEEIPVTLVLSVATSAAPEEPDLCGQPGFHDAGDQGFEGLEIEGVASPVYHRAGSRHRTGGLAMVGFSSTHPARLALTSSSLVHGRWSRCEASARAGR
jgi:hypothetical protein